MSVRNSSSLSSSSNSMVTRSAMSVLLDQFDVRQHPVTQFLHRLGSDDDAGHVRDLALVLLDPAPVVGLPCLALGDLDLDHGGVVLVCHYVLPSLCTRAARPCGPAAPAPYQMSCSMPVLAGMTPPKTTLRSPRYLAHSLNASGVSTAHTCQHSPAASR